MRQLYYTIQTLLRGGGSNAVKLVSLTLGLLIGVLLFSQIAFELSYENFYREPERVAVLRQEWQKDGKPNGDYDYTTNGPAAADLWEAMQELIESASLSANFWKPEIYVEGKRVEDVQLMCADTLYFQTVGLEVLRGDPKELADMKNLFLSQSKAREMFGDEDPVGRTINVGGYFDATVRGIYQDVPANTIFQHNVILSMAVMDWGFGRGTWATNDIYYVLYRLRKPSDVETMNAQVQKAAENFTETRFGNDRREFSVQSLPDIYLSRKDTRQRLTILAALGFSIFFVSIMNYVLAAIASMNRRAKAVGVHKCSGASSGHILGMFLWETGLMVVASIFCGWLLTEIFGDKIEEMLGTRLAELFTPQNLYVPLLTVLILFLVAGVWPGVMYARIPVTQVFRRYTDSKRGWKRGLLFVQFAGVAFILGVLLTAAVQYHDLMTRDVGFQDEGLVVGNVRNPEDAQTLSEALRRQPFVESAAIGSQSLMEHYSAVGVSKEDGSSLTSLHFMQIDKDFPQVAGMKLLQGSWPQHKGEALIGRKTMVTMHWEEDPIGKKLPINPEYIDLDGEATVVGVIEDIREFSFFTSLTCTAYILSDRKNRAVNVRLKAPFDDNLKRLREFIAEGWPDKKWEFKSYTEIRQQQNEEVYRFRNTVYATGACILLIVLMGVIGYVSDETQRRSKEIAIRKVNGAEASDILRLLSVDILKVAVGAVAIGAAFSWYVSGIWMEQFPDSTLFSPAYFALLSLLLLVLIVAIVVLKARRIANENPVVSIKSE